MSIRDMWKANGRTLEGELEINKRNLEILDSDWNVFLEPILNMVKEIYPIVKIEMTALKSDCFVYAWELNNYGIMGNRLMFIIDCDGQFRHFNISDKCDPTKLKTLGSQEIELICQMKAKIYEIKGETNEPQ